MEPADGASPAGDTAFQILTRVCPTHPLCPCCLLQMVLPELGYGELGLDGGLHPQPHVWRMFEGLLLCLVITEPFARCIMLAFWERIPCDRDSGLVTFQGNTHPHRGGPTCRASLVICEPQPCTLALPREICCNRTTR